MISTVEVAFPLRTLRLCVMLLRKEGITQRREGRRVVIQRKLFLRCQLI